MRRFVKRWMLSPGLYDTALVARDRLVRAMHSAEDRRLLAENVTLEDRHRGKRVFVLGAGSSIARQDLHKLKGEIVVSVSNTFVHPLFLEFQPRYHVVPSMLSSHGVHYSEDNFVVWLREMEKGTGSAEMVFHIGDRAMIRKNGLFKDRIVHWVEYSHWNGRHNTPIDLSWVPRIWSVSELAVTIAVYMGFDKIYLIGFDHDWFNGAMVYFYDHRKEHVMRPAETDLNYVDAEFQMQRHISIFQKYKYLASIRHNVFNANTDPHHYLDVFPKVDFDSLF